MSESALALAHAEIVAAARAHVEAALERCVPEGVLVPLGLPVHLFDALRELDRLGRLGQDWEQALDGLAGMLMEGSTEGAPADEPS